MVRKICIDDLHRWFLDLALPIWSLHGVDRKYGGFYERLYHDLMPYEENRRTRLVCRQIYFFSVGATLGWDGPIESLINHGLQFLLSHLITADGQVKASCDRDGLIIDDRQYLYDVAFVLIALAKIVKLFPENNQAEDLARRIASRLSLRYSHPQGGYFDEYAPERLAANPHMHLFEAFLTWSELHRFDEEFWSKRAYDCGILALRRMILPDSGALPEFYDLNWCPDRINNTLTIEPGHQFEWSWLLARWSLLANIPEAADAAARLCAIAEFYGVDPYRNVTFESIEETMIPRCLTARLWQQTERVKAWYVQSLLTNSTNALDRCDKALDGFKKFLSGPRPGLWFDTMSSSGSFLSEPVKSSSGYHIACAIETVLRPSVIDLS
jgi:mannose/cellobiose epimerase-like protein (N-acyl-D-glucosamine 2-epimerase family)